MKRNKKAERKEIEEILFGLQKQNDEELRLSFESLKKFPRTLVRGVIMGCSVQDRAFLNSFVPDLIRHGLK